MSESRLGRVFRHRADRLTAAWRRICTAQGEGRNHLLLLDGVVEPFIEELGAGLAVQAPGAWGRTRGVLRFSAARGAGALRAEFAALRRCLEDAVSTLGATLAERALVSQSIDEALASAIELARRIEDPSLPEPSRAFSGIVVEIFEKPRAAMEHPTPTTPSELGAAAE